MTGMTTARGLNRRAFLGATAGTAAAAAAATTLGPFRPGAGADADPSAHDMTLPSYRVGWQIFTGPTASTWRSGTAGNPGAIAEANTLPVAHPNGVHAFEGASGRFEGFVNNNESDLGVWTAGHQAYAEWAVANRVILVGDHAGPDPSSANNTARAVAKMAAWEAAGNRRSLGRGGNTPGQTAGTTEAAQLTNVNAYLAMNETLNLWGWRYQNGFDGVGDSIDGARYYQHTHREWATWNLLADGHKYKDVRQMEMSYDDEDGLDSDYAFVEIDLAWIHEGVRLDANRLHGAGTWTLEQIRDEVVRLMGLYGDRTPFYHVKDVSPTGGAQHTGDPLGDAVPFQRIFQQLKDPGDHWYLIERDGAGNNWAEVMEYGGKFLNGVDQDHDPGEFMPGVLLDRSLVGAPANITEPSVVYPEHGNPGAKARCQGEHRGEWARLPQRHHSFQWLRDGIPIVGATSNTYHTQSADAETAISIEVKARNSSGATIELSDPVHLAGSGPPNITPPSLSGSGAIGTMITCDRGEWGGSGSYSYQWLANGSPIAAGTGPGQTGSTNPARFRSQVGFSGQSITCEVTRSNPSGSTTVPTSNSVTIP